jgi:hypothetical protein
MKAAMSMMNPKANQSSSVGMIDIMTSRTRHCTDSLQEFSVASAASGSPFLRCRIENCGYAKLILGQEADASCQGKAVRAES